ncbi:MAG TPA: CAP domain-containing protein [Anaerolineales bacterium]|nr:CAP domain-containing protein [Anaerolineales bacterium]
MKRRLLGLLIAATIVLAPGLMVEPASADRLNGPAAQDAYSVIDAVNSLRASQGLPAYTANSTLMAIAQSHAEYMASSGNVSHTGPDGSRPYQRALAAGYPLAGQIPPGFFSENIHSGSDLSPQGVVQAWTGDAPHLNTMTSASLQEIGAGVAVSGGRVYYVIDCARPTGSGLPQAYTPGAAESSFSSANELIMPVTKSTPNADGEIIHEVQAGQSLWQIAIEYGVKIDEIRGLNQLSAAYIINPGDTLLVMTVATPTPVPETPAPPPQATVTIAPAATAEAPSPTPTNAPAPLPVLGTGGAVGATIVVALIAAALIAWAGRARLV